MRLSGIDATIALSRLHRRGSAPRQPPSTETVSAILQGVIHGPAGHLQGERLTGRLGRIPCLQAGDQVITMTAHLREQLLGVAQLDGWIRRLG